MSLDPVQVTFGALVIIALAVVTLLIALWYRLGD